MIEKNKFDAIVDAIVKARTEPPNLIEQCNALRAENERLFQELKDQYIKNAFLEYELRPKKRGRKPKIKPESENNPKKLGRPPQLSDELLIEAVDALKDKHGFKTNKDALRELFRLHGYTSDWRIEGDIGTFETRLSKARNKK